MAQLTMIFMLAIGLNNHVIIIPLLLRAAGRDAWFAVCLSIVFVLIGMMVVQYIVYAAEQQHIGLWLRGHIGAITSNILLVFMSLTLFFNATLTIRDTVTWAKIYLPTTPTLALVIPLVGLCFYSAYLGIGSIAITSGILLPLVVIFGFFVGISNLPHKDIALLFPLLEHGWNPVVKGAFYSAAGFSELYAVLCIQHYVKTEIRYWMLAVNILILAWLTLGPLYGAITEFGPTEATSLRYPPYEEWRLVTFGHFFEHVDFLALYQWISGALTRISLMMFLIVELFRLQQGKKRTWSLIILFVLSFGFSVLPISSMQFTSILENILVPGTLYCVSGVVFALFMIAWWSRHREVRLN